MKLQSGECGEHLPCERPPTSLWCRTCGPQLSIRQPQLGGTQPRRSGTRSPVPATVLVIDAPLCQQDRSSSVPWPGACGSLWGTRGDSWPPGEWHHQTSGSFCTWWWRGLASSPPWRVYVHKHRVFTFLFESVNNMKGDDCWSLSLSSVCINLSASLYFPSFSISWALLMYRSETSSAVIHLTASCKQHSRESLFHLGCTQFGTFTPPTH